MRTKEQIKKRADNLEEDIRKMKVQQGKMPNSAYHSWDDQIDMLRIMKEQLDWVLSEPATCNLQPETPSP